MYLLISPSASVTQNVLFLQSTDYYVPMIMASIELLEILLDTMRHAWDYFERIQRDLVGQAVRLIVVA